MGGGVVAVLVELFPTYRRLSKVMSAIAVVGCTLMWTEVLPRSTASTIFYSGVDTSSVLVVGLLGDLSRVGVAGVVAEALRWRRVASEVALMTAEMRTHI